MNVSDILRTNYLSVNQDDTLSKVFGKLGEAHKEAVVLDAKGHYVGMLQKRALIKSHVDVTAVKVKTIANKSATLTMDMSVERAGALMHTADAHVLPVLDGNKVLGIAGARDVLDALKANITGKAGDICTKRVQTLLDTDSIAKALPLFREQKLDHVPIVDKNENLVGIVSVLDLITRFFNQTQGSPSGRASKHGRTSKSGQDSGEKTSFTALPLMDIMTKLVATVSPNAKATDVIQLMRQREISSIIVVQNDKPVGIITSKDLLREACA